MCLDARDLGDLVDKIEERARNAYDFVVHNFEEFSGKETGLADKVDGVSFF